VPTGARGQGKSHNAGSRGRPGGDRRARSPAGCRHQKHRKAPVVSSANASRSQRRTKRTSATRPYRTRTSRRTYKPIWPHAKLPEPPTTASSGRNSIEKPRCSARQLGIKGCCSEERDNEHGVHGASYRNALGRSPKDREPSRPRNVGGKERSGEPRDGPPQRVVCGNSSPTAPAISRSPVIVTRMPGAGSAVATTRIGSAHRTRVLTYAHFVPTLILRGFRVGRGE
jgi:hypothetical protein